MWLGIHAFNSALSCQVCSKLLQILYQWCIWKVCIDSKLLGYRNSSQKTNVEVPQLHVLLLWRDRKVFYRVDSYLILSPCHSFIWAICYLSQWWYIWYKIFFLCSNVHILEVKFHIFSIEEIAFAYGGFIFISIQFSEACQFQSARRSFQEPNMQGNHFHKVFCGFLQLERCAHLLSRTFWKL